MKRIWSWGANNAGQLGLGFQSEQVSTPTQVNTLGDQAQNILAIAGGGCHTLLLLELNGQSVLSHFGQLSYKQVQNGPSLPINQQFFSSEKKKKTQSVHEQIVCGWDFNIFLDSYGNLHTSGENTFGQLGRELVKTPPDGLFQKIEFETETRFICAAVGMRHAAAISHNPNSLANHPQFELYTWGDNSKGQLGLGQISTSKIIPEPTKVQIVQEDSTAVPIKVRCSQYTTLVLMSSGQFYASGLNKFGMFGEIQSENGVNVRNFIHLSFLEDKCNASNVKDFQCGWNHVLVLLADGRILSWGRNNFGQLGRKSNDKLFDWNPGFVEGLPEPIASIKCGTEHNLALGESGRLYSWGWNEHDNCGVKSDQGSDDDQFIPLPTLVRFPEDQKISVIGCGAGTGFAVSV